MAIQLPKIGEQPQEDQEHAPRIESPGINAVAPMQQQQTALQGVAQQVVKFQNDQRDREADTISTDKKNDYLMWRKKRLYGDPDTGWAGYTNMKSDPQELYQKFDKEQEDYLNQLSTPDKDQDWAQETQVQVNRRLGKSYEEGQLETLTQYSNQKRKYDDDVSDTSAKLAQNGMYGASGYVVPGQASTFGPLEAKIAEIRQTRIEKALRYNTATIDDNGDTPYVDQKGNKQFVKLSPSAKLEISTDVAKGLHDATENLINSKALDKAKAVKDWADQNDYLDTASTGKLQAQLDKADKTKQAFDAADESRKRGIGYLDTIADPEVRHEALKIRNEDDAHIQALKDRKSKENYNNASNYVAQIQRSTTPFTGPIQMENDPKLAQLLPNITDAKEKQALYHQVDQPKTTSVVAQTNIQKLFFGQDPDFQSVRGMAPEDFNKYLGGLSKTDRNVYTRRFEALNSQNGAQIEQQYKAFGTEFEKQAVGAQLLQKFPNSNFYIPADQIKDQQYKKELLSTIDSLGPMGPKERSDYVAKWIADKKAGVAFQSPTRQTFKGTTSPSGPAAPGATPQAPPPPASTSVGSNIDVQKFYGSLNPAARLQYIMDYKKTYKVAPNTEQLVDFIQKQVNGKK